MINGILRHTLALVAAIAAAGAMISGAILLREAARGNSSPSSRKR